MSLVRVWSRGRRKILIASVMPAAIIGIPLALLLISQLRSLGRLEQASRQMLTQSAVRVAEELADEIRRGLTTAPRELVDSIPEAAVREWDLPAVRAVLRKRGDTPPVGIASFFIGRRTDDGPDGSAGAFSVLFHRRERDAGPAVTAFSARAKARGVSPEPRWITTQEPLLERYVVDRVREVQATGLADVCGYLMLEGEHHLFVLRLYYADPARSRAVAFVGLALRAEDLTRAYFARLVTEVRGSERAFSIDEPVEVSILDERRRELYRTGPSLLTRHVHEAEFPLHLLDDDLLFLEAEHHPPVMTWWVRSGYPGTNAAALARSSTNQQRQLLFLVTLVAAVGIVLSGRAIARELGVAEMKAEFVSSISHDLKTPIASIQVLADILQGGAMHSPERVRHYGQVIGSETRKLGKLIEGILEFERIDAGGRMYTGTEIDLRAPVRDAVGEFATQLKETGFRTELRLPAEPVPFVGDADALVHAFGNLIGNAIKYAGDERYLRVAMRLNDSNAVIRVHDRGRGIPAAERAKIFDRFYRVRRDSGTDPAGTGLGLSIAQHVVRCHGGRISVSGKAEGGTVFTIEIPLVYAAGEPPSGAPR